MNPISATRARWAVGAATVAVAAGAVGYGFGQRAIPSRPSAAAAAPHERKVLYWYDPMAPDQHFARPGKSPMGMEMVPRYADEAAGKAGVQVDPAQLQNLGVRYASVERTSFAEDLAAPGVLAFNQRDVAIVQARAAGFVQRVYARAPGDVVRAGAPIADLLVPSWGGAQAEYLAVRRTGDRALEAAARQRLRLLGMPEGLIDAVDRSGRPRTVVTVATPIGGAIQTLDVRAGMTVATGQTLAQVSGLGTVWLDLAIPEAQAAAVRIGAPARVEFAAFPGEVFSGRVGAILPAAQAESRTLQVRVELPNTGGRLHPGMFATAHLGGAARGSLVVPSEAVIRTGRRALVMLALEGGRFEPVEVQAGRESEGRTEILAGLSEGQKVVASGQFLIDSEASLAGLQARPLAAAPTAERRRMATLYETEGRIEALNGDQITLSHQPVAGLGWPAMTMTFRLDPPALANGLKTGDRVEFAFEPNPEGAVIRKIRPAGGAR